MDVQITKIFKSRRLAIVLIVLIILLSILGTHIPQKTQLKPEIYNSWQEKHPEEAKIFDYLGFTRLFSSLPFVSLALLLFINTFACTKGMLDSSIRRFKENKQFNKKAFIEGLERHAVIKTEGDLEHAHSAIQSVLSSEGYRVAIRENRLSAEKNRIGIFGTPLFHICILFLIVAAVYGSTGRMEGDMQLIEGQSLPEDHGSYKFINEGPFFHENHKKFNISLEKFYADYFDETDTPRGPAGKLSIIENGKIMKTDIVYTNNQMNYGGYTFLGNVYGLAPLLVMTNPDGTVYSGSYIIAVDQDNSQRYVSYFDLGDTGLEGGLMVYMTAPLTTEIAETRNVGQIPILFLRIFDNGKEVYNGTMRLNNTLKIGDKTLGFYNIKYWSNFYVVKDDSIFMIITGFGLIILSLFISFFIVHKRIWVDIVDNEKMGSKEIYIGGKSDKFRSLYGEEFSGIINKLEKRLSNGTD